MLTALRLGNFKAFADTQDIPIRPLTLIFGANSSGKSSIIHSLLLAIHAFGTGELDIHRTEVGGESVDLGGFRQYIHRRDPNNRLEWVAEIDVGHLEGQLAELLTSARKVSVGVHIGLRLNDKGQPLTGTSPEVLSCEITVDGVVIARMSRRDEETLQLDRIESTHPVIKAILRAIIETGTTATSFQERDLDIVTQALNSIVPDIRIRSGNLIPSELLGLRVRGTPSTRQIDQLQRQTHGRDISSDEPVIFPVSKGNRESDLTDALTYFFPRTLDNLITGLRAAIGQELYRAQYLGPLRSYPPRHIAFAQHHDQNWFAGGGYAWDVVRKNKQVRDAVNAWLNSPERLQTPYLLAIRELIGAEDLQVPLSDMFQKASELVEAEGVIPMLDDPEAAASAFIKQVSSGEIEKINELILMDNRTRTQVSHRDVGIGISQVLPVLVTAYASRNKILAMEQPEIHLHPALQAELGDVFIESAIGERKNTLILETHSEHLILRIMRRMRETAQNKLVPGHSPVKPSDVAVLYIKADSSGSKVLELRLDDEGTLLDPWPGGFFEEGFRERFA